MIDRLAADLHEAYPDMKGFSPRNLKYMRAFAAAWPDAEIVQRVVARWLWRQNVALLERVGDKKTRLGRCAAWDVPAPIETGEARTAIPWRDKACEVGGPAVLPP